MPYAIQMGPPPNPNREPFPFAGTLNFHGLLILVENPPGSVRSGVGPDGRPWRTTMRHHYGEIAGAMGVDGDATDAFVGDRWDAEIAYVVHQSIAPDAEGGHGYDEDKVMLGFADEDEAVAAYRSNFNDGVGYLGGVTAIPVAELRDRLLDGDLSVAPMAITLSKSLPAGYQPIPGGKHGGGRKRDGAGWVYWYPDGGHTTETRDDWSPFAGIASAEETRAVGAGLWAYWKARGVSRVEAADWAKFGEVKSVPLDKIVVLAGNKIIPSKVAFYRKKLQDEKKGAPGRAYLLGGRYYLQDGHHRALAAAAAGQTATDLLVVDLAADKLGLSKSEERTMLPAVEAEALIAKSEHPPAGFQPIPGGKHGGFRKPSADGWDYWYPGQHPHETAHRYEWDTSKRSGTEDIQPGALVEVGGRAGVYRWTPEHGAAPKGMTWVTHLGTGASEAVREDTVHPVRVKAARPPVLPPPPPKRPLPPPPPPKVWGPGDGPPKPLPAVQEPGPGAKRAAVFEESRARPGSILAKLEGGEYMLGKFRSTRDGGGFHDGIVVPREDQAAMLDEFAPMIRGVVQKVGKRYHISLGDGQYGRTAAHDEIMAGATAGFVESLRHYKGGVPFLVHSGDYAMMFAIREARNEMGAGARIPDRMMRVLGGFAAARGRARSRYGTDTPSPEQVASTWTVRKKDVYTGTADNLGSYADGDKAVDQANEEVPDGPWKIRGPGGKELGEPMPGKLQLVASMGELLQAGKVEDSEWMIQNPKAVLPGRQGSAVPLGSALQIRSEAEEILADMPDRERKALEMKFGFHAEDGEEASVEEIANAIGIDQAKAAPTKRKEVAALLKNATTMFKQKAAARSSAAHQHVDAWAKLSDPAHEVGGVHRPTPRDMRSRFGSDERVNIYTNMVANGHGHYATGVLDREAAGTATESESHGLRTMYYQNRRRERLAAFERFNNATSVDPATARDTGPSTGSDPAGIGLHPDDVIEGWKAAAVKGARN